MFFLRINLTINVAHPVFLMHTQSLLSGYTPGRHSLIIKPRWPLGARRSHYSTTAKEAAVTRASSLASLKMKQKHKHPLIDTRGSVWSAVPDRSSDWTSEGASVYPLTAHHVQQQSSYAHLYKHLTTDLSSKGHREEKEGNQSRKQSVRAKVPGKQSKIELWHHWEIYDSELNCNLNLKL